MQNLPHPYRQKDKPLYQAITPEGARNYEHLYMSGDAADESNNVRGIPADDLNIFATLVFALKDRTRQFQRLRKSGRSVRHIDSGTGPSLYTFIASMPYADELIPIDVTPANIDRLTRIATGEDTLPAHWQAWLEIGGMLYDIASPAALLRLDAERPELYDKLRHYPNLRSDAKKRLQKAIRAFSHGQAKSPNPYASISLKAALAEKLKPRPGDILDDVEPLADLVGTADIYTHVFFSESIDNTLAIVAHAEANGIQFAKDGAFTLSAHMSMTIGYKGFFTPEELASNPEKKLSELPATPAFFEALLGELVSLTDEYRGLWETLTDIPEERKMVRQGMTYSGAVILCGNANYKNSDGSVKFENGPALLRALRHTLRTVISGEADEHTLHCTIHDIGLAVNELTSRHFEDSATMATFKVLQPVDLD